MDAHQREELSGRVMAFLNANAGRRPAAEPVTGSGMFALHSVDGDMSEMFAAARTFQGLLFDAGLAGSGVPSEYGGCGSDGDADQCLRDLMEGWELPHPMPLAVGLGLAVGTLLAHGTEEQKSRHIAPTLRAEEVWCQLFSEPEAGSDLASMRTAARRDGDSWVVNGQKVWTSFAPFADWGLLLARTDPHAVKHKGITMFILDMRAPGVDIRPLREITGGQHFNEIFLSDVHVPDADRLGAINDGWSAAMTTLGNERGAIRTSNARYGEALVHLASEVGRSGESPVRQALVRTWSLERIATILRLRADATRSTGRPPGPEGSLLKLLNSQLAQAAAELACQMVGPASTAWDPTDGSGELLSYELMYSRMTTIAGGTSEIQRNIIGERALGLPRH